jgi:copper chaperone CopZ
MQTLMKNRPSLLTTLPMGALAFSISTARAELLKVEQVVYGMDCAPCAYGLEKSLKKIAGVKEVTVSLNKGTATLELKPGNKVTVKKIKEVIRVNGFTPKRQKFSRGRKKRRQKSKLGRMAYAHPASQILVRHFRAAAGCGAHSVFCFPLGTARLEGSSLI